MGPVSPLLGSILGNAFFTDYQECVASLKHQHGIDLLFSRSLLETARSGWKADFGALLSESAYNPADPQCWREPLALLGPHLCASRAVSVRPGFAPLPDVVGTDILAKYPTEYVGLQYLFQKHSTISFVSQGLVSSENVALFRPGHSLSRVQRVVAVVAANHATASNYADLMQLR